jgi:enediyne biosynthesis protein E4
MRNLAFALLALAACLAGCGKSRSPDSQTPSAAQAGASEWFEDMTARSGIRFLHLAPTNYFMPDQMGSGAALLDADGDGRLDVYLVQNGGPGSTAPNQLFLQQPDGTFRNASSGSGLEVAGQGMGAIAGDVNNDGRPDLVVTEYGAVRFFQNLGHGQFRETTRESGLDNPRWAVPASFFDYDRDGWLDLVVGNYVDYDPTYNCYDLQGRQDFCAPKAFASTITRLWHNVTQTPGGIPRFEDRTEPAGLTRVPGAALGFVCADFDGDGWPDIFCADDGRPNRLFLNQHNGVFREEAARRGLAYNAMGDTAANMGTAFGDVDGDGLGDLFVTHLAEEFHSLWRQGPPGLFFDHVAASGLQQQGWRGTGFGAVLADFDADAHLDLVFLNGLVRRAVPSQTPVQAGVSAWWGRYAQRPQLFANEGGGRFRDVSSANPSLCSQALVGRSLAGGDLDNDGAPDLIVCGVGGPVRVYRNVAPRRGHWLRLRLLDSAHGNRDAIGAEVTVRGEGRRWWSLLQPATSYLASQDPTLHIGLGEVTTLSGIDVVWADGLAEHYPAVAVDRILVLHQGTGNVQPLTK